MALSNTKGIVYNDNELKEIETSQGGSYHFLTKDGDNWKLAYTSMERAPKEKTIGIYVSKKDGANSFLLDRLSSHFLHKYVSTAKEDNRINQLLIEKKLTIDDLFNALSQCNIPETYLSIQNFYNHSIRMLEEDGRWMSEYIDINGISHKRTMPKSLPDCISFAFTRTMYLYLIDKTVEKYFGGKKSHEYFTAEEIASFVS